MMMTDSFEYQKMYIYSLNSTSPFIHIENKPHHTNHITSAIIFNTNHSTTTTTTEYILI